MSFDDFVFNSTLQMFWLVNAVIALSSITAIQDSLGRYSRVAIDDARTEMNLEEKGVWMIFLTGKIL